jgi:hypothetical protein
MKREVILLVVGAALATAVVSAQGTAPPPPPPTQQQQTQQTPPTPPAQPAQADAKAPEVVVQGCVIQGSAPTVFILDNARVDPEDKNEKANTYVLISSSEDLSLRAHLNHEVKVTGLAEVKSVPVPPPGQKVAEKDLPKFTAKAITMVADRCTTGAR